VHVACRIRSASFTHVKARSDLAKSDEQWFAQLRLEVERVTRAHMQVGSATAGQEQFMIHMLAGNGPMRASVTGRAYSP
jgi:hypothetical protein